MNRTTAVLWHEGSGKGGDGAPHWVAECHKPFNVKERSCLGFPCPRAVKCVQHRHDLSLKIPLSRRDNALLRGIRLIQLSHHHHPLQQVSLGTWPECSTNVDLKCMKSTKLTCACCILYWWLGWTDYRLSTASNIVKALEESNEKWLKKEVMLWRHSFLNMNIYGMVFLHVRLISETWFGEVFSKWD